jgi:DNA-binding transcriptional MerR regulator
MAKTITVPEATDLLPDPEVARRYGVNPRTLFRWDDQPALNFPRPIRINNRKYRRLHELESWERERVA